MAFRNLQIATPGAWLILVLGSLEGHGGSLEISPAHRELVTGYLESYCLDCHEGKKAKADLSLSATADLTLDDWGHVLSQVAIDEMPPPEETFRPSFEERAEFLAWLQGSLRAAGRSPKLPGGPLPAHGNLVDHAQLFSDRHQGPAASPPRFWRRSQPQYDALMERLWVIPRLRYEKAHRRNDPEWAAFSYSKPFPALDPRHFSNYSGAVNADEATLRALLSAGGQLAERLTAEKPAYSKEHQPPVANGIPSIRRGSRWEKFIVHPPERPREFLPFLTATAAPDGHEQAEALTRVFQLILNRKPHREEKERYGKLLARSINKSGAAAALRGLITAVVVSPEFVFRMEVGMSEPDRHGRRMLSPRELVYAIGYALSDAGPDEELWNAAEDGRLANKADVAREVRRLLEDPGIEKNRRLRFFQEFFGYPRALEVFKDRSGWHREIPYLVRDADLLIEHILENDRDVFRQLLTTDRYFVAYPKIDDAELFAALQAHTIESVEKGITRTRERGREIQPSRDGSYNRAWAHLQGKTLIPRTVHNDPARFEVSYLHVYGFNMREFDWTPEQPIKVPGRRAGILTHPAWLVAHSTNTDNDVVRRGLWIREHLLAGKVPDVPIEVEAQVPEEANETLRHRMRVTRAEKCVRCHQRMDPLGFPFEIYDHYGKYRESEKVGPAQKQDKPIDASGGILVSGEAGLDGPVEDAIALVHRLADSPRVRQSMVRHAFRYWMGRNETLADSPTIKAADQAYRDNAGSFDALLVSLLTSDSFLYRK